MYTYIHIKNDKVAYFMSMFGASLSAVSQGNKALEFASCYSIKVYVYMHIRM